MAAATSRFSQPPYLSAQQQGLLRTALESNKRAKAALGQPQDAAVANRSSTKVSRSSDGGPSTFGDSLFPDFIDSNTTFDMDFPAIDGDLLDEYSTLVQNDGAGLDSADTGEKRKSPEDDEDEEDDMESGKRRGSEEKVAKKPGRKLITTEPTTKRKAQNRAAQRAFRDRKEKHLKDLELKVSDLEKISDSTSQENGVLRAEIERLQNELSDYKKRLSISVGATNTSPIFKDSFSLYTSPSQASGHLSDFQFDFPRLGGLTNNEAPTLENNASPSALNGSSPATQASSSLTGNGFNGKLFPASPDIQANKDGGVRPFGTTAMFGGIGDIDYGQYFGSPQDLTNSTSHASSGRQTSHFSPSYSTSSADSPASSADRNNRTSSCGTSPEPVSTYNMEGTKSFSDLDFGNSMTYQDQLTSLPAGQSLYDFSGIEWLSNQNGGQFNPELFGDYRESQAAVVGNGDFSSGLFEEPYDFQDLGGNATNLNLNLANMVNFAPSDGKAAADLRSASSVSTQQSATPKPAVDLLERVTACANGDTGQEPEVSDREFMTTHKLWNSLQTCPRFLSGDLDIDSLCTELSAKATCSESGMSVPKDVVEKVLWRLAGVHDQNDKAPAESANTNRTREKHEKSLDRKAMRPLDGCP